MRYGPRRCCVLDLQMLVETAREGQMHGSLSHLLLRMRTDRIIIDDNDDASVSATYSICLYVIYRPLLVEIDWWFSVKDSIGITLHHCHRSDSKSKAVIEKNTGGNAMCVYENSASHQI